MYSKIFAICQSFLKALVENISFQTLGVLIQRADLMAQTPCVNLVYIYIYIYIWKPNSATTAHTDALAHNEASPSAGTLMNMESKLIHSKFSWLWFGLTFVYPDDINQNGLRYLTKSRITSTVTFTNLGIHMYAVVILGPIDGMQQLFNLRRILIHHNAISNWKTFFLEIKRFLYIITDAKKIITAHKNGF